MVQTPIKVGKLAARLRIRISTARRFASAVYAVVRVCLVYLSVIVCIKRSRYVHLYVHLFLFRALSSKTVMSNSHPTRLDKTKLFCRVASGGVNEALY